MTVNLIHQRCLNHAAREAVARCPECRQFFCRECVTEHDDRIICANCLKKLARVPLFKKPAFAWLVRTGQCAVGVLLAWFFFHLMAEWLLKLPTEFHEGTLWEVRWIDK
ncbi:MAG TPA: rhomboid family protein [Verrucomicrobiae bacterium]|nr:rhomboid family protein [Verrucomicrobiae bacterium]